MHLAMLFDDVRDGFYVDVGAGHPVADNVSFKAYLNGWRGVVVEPQAALCRLYAGIRPRDTALNLLVGEASGEAAFHRVERLHGFSTTVIDHAESARQFGAAYATEHLPMSTLADILAQHADGQVHWLKIDVEGAEEAVLAGADFTRHRPACVLVEAVRPGDMAPSHQAWEPLLTRADYHFVMFDGLNRFYLAAEAAALASRLPARPLDWALARHLWDHGHARENADHPDYALAVAFAGIDPAALPLTPDDVLFGFLTKNMTADELAEPATIETLERFAYLWLGNEPHSYKPAVDAGRPLEDALLSVIRHDGFRAALGRISAAYDGGFIMD